jgi:Arc/MetJ family transcription regulator
MAKTVIDLDEDLLSQTQDILGTATKKDTVNEAMRRVVRDAAVREFMAMAREGVFQDLANAEVMAEAWR